MLQRNVEMEVETVDRCALLCRLACLYRALMTQPFKIRSSGKVLGSVNWDSMALRVSVNEPAGVHAVKACNLFKGIAPCQRTCKMMSLYLH